MTQPDPFRAAKARRGALKCQDEYAKRIAAPEPKVPWKDRARLLVVLRPKTTKRALRRRGKSA